MSLKIVLTVAALSLSLAAAQSHAEGEGNGDPFPFRAAVQLSGGAPFVADTGSAAYPVLTGLTNLQPSTTRMVQAFSNEAPVQTVNSLPTGFSEDAGNFAQANIQRRDIARK